MAVKIPHGVYYKDGTFYEKTDFRREAAKKGTITASVIAAHNRSGNGDALRLGFDALASHDITYVGIIQTLRACGFESFRLPYVLTNCHNSLCAVGGTINEDDHRFGLSAAKKYGGVYVPAHIAVIHAYMRECFARCGAMILGSDSHTRYGALGTLAIGEGGPEIVKQLVGLTYDIASPEVVAVKLTGKPRPGVGPHDIALELISAVYSDGFVKNRVLEFVGEGISGLSAEFRNGIDVMTTETACLSSIWETDEVIRDYYTLHNRPEAYKPLHPADGAYYDRAIELDMSQTEPMIALPYHPSNAVKLRELIAHPKDILSSLDIDLTGKIGADGRIRADQGVIAGCAGGIFDNLCAAADILRGKSTGNGAFSLSAYPASQPVLAEIIRNGVASNLVGAGAVLRTAFCGPCFGAGDVPSNGALSLRHSTRNFANREGSKPGEGQCAAVALMDARSIAATAANGGILTPADEYNVDYRSYEREYDDSAYRARVYNGYGIPMSETRLEVGPNIADWPAIPALPAALLLRIASVIEDEVTTTDELIPSGETSSYRSNPLRLAQFTLSRRDSGYVKRALDAKDAPDDEVLSTAKLISGTDDIGFGSAIYCKRPGDGSAREQAASCQRVLGGAANVALEYATKRYRSNLINWGMLPLQYDAGESPFDVGDYLLITDAREVVASGGLEFRCVVISGADDVDNITLKIAPITSEEREILLAGCLINYYRNKSGE